jgi:peptide deformylase
LEISFPPPRRSVFCWPFSLFLCYFIEGKEIGGRKLAVLEILKYPHPILKKRSQAVSQIDEEVKKLIQDMKETMYGASGVGLAACQVGVSRRVIILDVSPMDPRHSFFALINPEIISEEGEIDHEEGCLSVPDCLEKVKRKEKVCVRGLSPQGMEIEIKGDGILAIALQHEIDHINGVLILDRVSRLKREIYRNKLKKEKRKEEKP